MGIRVSKSTDGILFSRGPSCRSSSIETLPSEALLPGAFPPTALHPNVLPIKDLPPEALNSQALPAGTNSPFLQKRIIQHFFLVVLLPEALPSITCPI